MKKNEKVSMDTLKANQYAKKLAVNNMLKRFAHLFGVAYNGFKTFSSGESFFGAFEDDSITRLTLSRWISEEIYETATAGRDSDNDYEEDHAFWEAMSIVNLVGIVDAVYKDHSSEIKFLAFSITHRDYLLECKEVFDVLLDTKIEDILSIQQRKIERAVKRNRFVPYLKPLPQNIVPLIAHIQTILELLVRDAQILSTINGQYHFAFNHHGLLSANAWSSDYFLALLDTLDRPECDFVEQSKKRVCHIKKS